MASLFRGVTISTNRFIAMNKIIEDNSRRYLRSNCSNPIKSSLFHPNSNRIILHHSQMNNYSQSSRRIWNQSENMYKSHEHFTASIPLRKSNPRLHNFWRVQQSSYPCKSSFSTLRHINSLHSHKYYNLSFHSKNLSHQWKHYSPLFINLGSLSHMTSWNSKNNNRKTTIPKISNKSRVGLASSLIGSAFLLGGKTKYLIGALKLTKFASLGSMFVTVGTYSLFFGLPYAVGMVSLILIHESGHALAMRHYKIPFSPMIFVPFFGASVAMNKMPMDAYQEAMIALAGPVLGSMGAVGMAGMAHVTQSSLLFALADFGFMINLFNLLPIGMMDGGRICGALSPYAGVVGLGIGGTMIYADVISNPIFYLVMMGGAYSTFQRFYYPENIPQNYYKITPQQRAFLTGSYFGLLGFLMASMAFNERYKKSPHELEMERRYQQQQQQYSW